MKTLTEVDAALNELDPAYVGDVAAQVFFVSFRLESGNEKKLMKFGFNRDQLRVVIERYRKYGYWCERKGMALSENDIEFCLTIMVGQGVLVREYSEDRKTWLYSFTPFGQKQIDKI